MTKALFFLIPLASAIAMGFWLKQARQAGGHRWITHWLAALAPLGLLAGLHSIGLINNAVAQILMVPTVLGVAAFAGGALYLAGPTLLAFVGSSLFAPSLASQMKQGNAGDGLRKNTHEDPEDNASSFDNDDFGSPWSIENSQRAYMGIYDSHNAHGTFVDDDD